MQRKRAEPRQRPHGEMLRRGENLSLQEGSSGGGERQASPGRAAVFLCVCDLQPISAQVKHGIPWYRAHHERSCQRKAWSVVQGGIAVVRKGGKQEQWTEGWKLYGEKGLVTFHGEVCFIQVCYM